MQSELRREGLSMTIKSSSCDDHTAAFPPLGKGIKALMVWPDFPGSFWSFAGMMEMLDEKVVMPPLGLVTVAALCPKDWTIRLIDQQVDEVSDDDILWADLVMVSGMRVQRKGLEEILARARRLGRRTIVGGPYASGEPEVLLELADHVVAGEPRELRSRRSSAVSRTPGSRTKSLTRLRETLKTGRQNGSTPSKKNRT